MQHASTSLSRWRWLAGVVAFALAIGIATPGYSAAVDVDGGYIEWGVKTSFRNYIKGPIAKGAISVSGGASDRGSVFRFPVRSGTYDASGDEAEISFSGSVNFTGHDGQLDMTISSLRIERDGNRGALVADMESKQLEGGTTERYNDIELATFTISASNLDEDDDEVTWSNVGTALGADGVEAFGDFYQAGDELDPIALSLELKAAAISTPTRTPTATATPAASSTPTPAATVALTTSTTPTAVAAAPLAATVVANSSAAPSAAVATPVPAAPRALIVPPPTGDGGLLP